MIRKSSRVRFRLILTFYSVISLVRTKHTEYLGVIECKYLINCLFTRRYSLTEEQRDLSLRLRKLEGYEAIRNVFSEYSLRADCGRWNDVASLFSLNGVLKVSGYGNYGGVNYDGVFKTRLGIKKYYDSVTPSTLPKGKHNIIPKSIELNTSGTFWTAYMVAYLIGADNHAGGIYEAILTQCDDDSWRFLKLSCVNTLKKNVCDVLEGRIHFCATDSGDGWCA